MNSAKRFDMVRTVFSVLIALAISFVIIFLVSDRSSNAAGSALPAVSPCQWAGKVIVVRWSMYPNVLTAPMCWNNRRS